MYLNNKISVRVSLLKEALYYRELLFSYQNRSSLIYYICE
nr:MAG TPA: hypothetical protein [Caudoviricetes sp.]